MKLKLIWLSFLVCICIIPTHAIPSEKVSDSITVYIFLHESCVISQYCTLPLRELHQEYANEHIRFVGLFPNESSKPEHIQAFKDTYKLPFLVEADPHQLKTHALGATITPEVVVYNESKEVSIYRGRIDNSYARVGQRRRVTSSSELREVLEAIRTGQAPAFSNTPAVGCFIQRITASTPTHH